MSRCHRCDYHANGRADLTGHADQTGHPLCRICTRSLHPTEAHTCGICLANTRADLVDIPRLYQLLEHELGHIPTARYDRTGRSSETPLPGGDALVMLAGGNPSDAGRNGAEGRPDDPESIAVTLASWEDDWRRIRHEPPAMIDATAGDHQRRALTAAVDYLSRRLSWAADHHPAFDAFAEDITRLVSRLASTTHTTDATLIGVACLDCNRRLERQVTTRGLADHFECPRCHRRYGDTDYRLALRAHIDRRRTDATTAISTGAGWARPWQVAALLGVPVRTVRTWASRMLIGSRCDVETRQIEVAYIDAADRVEHAEDNRCA